MKFQKYFVLIMLLSTAIFGQEVYKSSFSNEKVNVLLTAQEIWKVKTNRNYSDILGSNVAWQMIKLSGIPESITGKVAGLAVWTILQRKYASDIERLAKTTKKCYNVTLQYKVNLEGVRKIWELSKYGDHIMPGSESSKQIIDLVNKLINSALIN